MAFDSFSVEIQNYRSFTVPTTIKLRPGNTAFVGPNNGGKSNVLRFFYELRNFFAAMTNPPNNSPSLHNFILQPNGWRGLLFHGVADPQSVFSVQNADPLRIRVSLETIPDARPVNDMMLVVPDYVSISITRVGENTVALGYEGEDVSRGAFESRLGHIYNSALMRGFNIDPYKDVFSFLHDSLYIGSFRNVINQGANTNYYDLVIGNALVAQWSQYQGGASQKEGFVAASVIEEMERTFGFKRLELVATNDGSNIKAFVERKPFLLSELGSGVSQFFITLVNLELNKRRLVLVDEPELGLHPLLQNDFVDSIARRSEALLFSTHSLGLARTVGDSLCTVVSIGPSGSSIVREFNDINNPLELLGELSYAGSFDMGLNKVLLVEGPTEIKLARSLLQRLGASHRVTVISLGGSSSISPKASHALVELRRLSEKVYAIVDSERDSANIRAIPERLKFERNCRRLGICCHLLELRSIESYFSEQAVKRVIGSHYDALGPYDKVPTNWPKQSNWRIAEAMELQDFKADDLVAFLRDVAEDA